jgi:hypothetical protein
MLPSKPAVGLTILLVFLAGPGALQAGLILDQQNVVTLCGTAYRVDGTFERAQTFTVGVTGSLEKISLELGAERSPGDLTIELLRTTSGVPDPSNIAATLTVPASMFPLGLFTSTLTDIDRRG